MGLKKPNFIKSTGGNCGIYSVLMVLSALNIDINNIELENAAYEQGISYFGELYTRNQICRLLDIVKEKCPEVRYVLVEYTTDKELGEALKENISLEKYILIPYYAKQGWVAESNSPNMNHGHWGIIYDIDSSNNIYGIQSNSKANFFGALNRVSMEKIFNSNGTLKNIKVNWGKYHKCNIEVCKKILNDTPRCCSELCKLNNKMQSRECIYYTDLNNCFISIYK